MKHFLIAYFLPCICAVFIVFFIAANPSVNTKMFPEQKQENFDAYTYIPSFNSHAWNEELFLQDNKNTIWILGSSELSSPSEALPFRFLSKHFPVKVKGIGHAGNQCFSIYCQLLANEDRLNDARIVIMVSPSWFESKAAKGTSSAVFLEYSSMHWQKKILDKEGKFADYAKKRISSLYSDLNSPGLELKLLNFEHQASKSFLHKAIYSPVIAVDRALLKQKDSLLPPRIVMFYPDMSLVVTPDSINWNRLISQSKSTVLSKATNNSMGINNEYYNEHIHGNTGNVSAVPEKYNQELQDFAMLVSFMRTKKADVSYIIAPLNPYYYTDLNELSPTVEKIKDILDPDDEGRPSYLSFFVSDTSAYSKAILTDVMHFSDHGWYNIDQFITLKYNLDK